MKIATAQDSVASPDYVAGPLTCSTTTDYSGMYCYHQNQSYSAIVDLSYMYFDSAELVTAFCEDLYAAKEYALNNDAEGTWNQEGVRGKRDEGVKIVAPWLNQIYISTGGGYFTANYKKAKRYNSVENIVAGLESASKGIFADN